MSGAGEPILSVSFREKMSGDIRFENGRVTRLVIEPLVRFDDIYRAMKNTGAEGTLGGQVLCAAWSSEPIAATGTIKLLAFDTNDPRSLVMDYRLAFRADGSDHVIIGRKTVRDDAGFDMWSDTTRLAVNVMVGGVRGKAIAQGELHLALGDFLRQLTTFEVRGSTSAGERARALYAFTRFFAGGLVKVFAPIVAPRFRLDAWAPPRTSRELDAPTPELHWITTGDGVPLRLVRYQGGPRGPVMLVHGLGVSGRIFTCDTIRQNLVEYLADRQFDVWVLENRTSIELATGNEAWTADDVAKHDYPAAVAKIRELTGSVTVQAVVHCFGSTSFFMSLLSGLEHVRSVAASQIATHFVAGPDNIIKSYLGLSGTLRRLGVRRLTAHTSTRDSTWQRAADHLLRFYPMPSDEQCTGATCRRITFLYGPLYEHSKLNTATHDTLHEMFGVASIPFLEQLSLMIRKRTLVSSDGRDIYLPHVARLKMPIRLIHGAQNRCFLPASTDQTMNWLTRNHGTSGNSRHIISGYGHIDCIFGEGARRDVYPLISEHLERT